MTDNKKTVKIKYHKKDKYIYSVFTTKIPPTMSWILNPFTDNEVEEQHHQVLFLI